MATLGEKWGYINLKVIKRDGRAVEYDSNKIILAIEKANKEVGEEKRTSKDEILSIINFIESLDKKRILVEDIQDIIEQKLMELKKYDLAKKYIVYRYTRALVRKQNTTDESILGLIKNTNNISNTEKNNAITASVQRNLIAGEVSKDLTKRMLLPEKITKAHEDGVLYFHATDYFLQPIINSCVVNIGDMLDNGTVINGQKIETPKSFQVACIVTTQIIAACASGQYGRQYINVKHFGKYLRASYIKIKNELEELENCNLTKETIEKIAKKRLQTELSSGVQTIQYQINTLITTYGKTPLVSLILELDDDDKYIEENLAIINEILNQKYGDIANVSENDCINSQELIYILHDDNRTKNEKYKYIDEYAIKCGIAINNIKNVDYKKEGTFNQGVVTINLPQIGIIANGNKEVFWKIFDERLELCFEALMCRHYALLGTVSDVSPIHWINGAISRLEHGEKIDKLLKDRYSTICLGYVGLSELVQIINNYKGIEKEDEEVSEKILKYLEEKIESWRKMTGICFSVCETKSKAVVDKFDNINKSMSDIL